MDDLKIYNELGAGSFGNVYRAQERSTGRVIAVKLVELDTTCDVDEMLLELRMLSELRCPQIIDYYGASLYDTTLFISMELCAGGACMNYLRSYGTFKEETAVYILAECLKGLAYIHGQHKIHRDLKSSNILITTEGAIKIADFGVSAQLSQTVPERHSFIGTPYWMAPEVIMLDHYDSAVDVWSLGIVAIELVAGDPPLRRVEPTKAMFKIAEGPPPELPRVVKNQTLSGAYCKMVASCLMKEPRARPTVVSLLKLRLFRHHTSSSKGRSNSSTIKPPVSFMQMVRREVACNGPACRTKTKAEMVERLRDDSTNNSRGSKASNNPSESNMDTWDFTENAAKLRPAVQAVHGHLKDPVKPATRSKMLPLLINKGGANQNVPPALPPRIPSEAMQTALEELPKYPGQPVHQVVQQPVPQPLPSHAQPAQGPAHPGLAKNTPAQPAHAPRRELSEVFHTYIRASLEAVERRANLPEAQERIRHLRSQMADADRDFPGFSKAFVEEIWQIITYNQQQRQQERAANQNAHEKR